MNAEYFWTRRIELTINITCLKFDIAFPVVIHLSAMGILRTFRKIAETAVRAVSILSVAFCLSRSVTLCFCDTDPDDCAEHCHDCSEPEESDSCKHLTIQIDEFLVPQTDSPLTDVALAIPAPVPIDAWSICNGPHTRPISTAPPDCGGSYVSYSTRIHPLS